MKPKKLRRSVKDKAIGGVAGGLGDYFTTDPLIFRILFVVLLLTGGGGALIYFLMWIFIPKEKTPNFEDSRTEEPETEAAEVAETKSKNGNLIGGTILILIGTFFLLENYWPWLDFSDLWPIALVIAGLAIVKMNYPSKKEIDDIKNSEPLEEKEESEKSEESI
jgi:phage shock protein PspC (stress-responsive transcriptional regulator)